MTTIEISRRVSGRLHCFVSAFLFRRIKDFTGAGAGRTLKQSTAVLNVWY